MDNVSIIGHEHWLEQVGEAELIGGWAEVALAAAFAAAADTTDYQVSLTSYDAMLDFVQNRTSRSFEIHVMRVPPGNRAFAARCGYRVVAPRLAASR